jgi:hypothetical protein
MRVSALVEDRTSIRLDSILLDFGCLLAALYVFDREPRHRGNTFLAETTRKLTNSCSKESSYGVQTLEANFNHSLVLLSIVA